MAQLLNIPTLSDHRGSLSVVENLLPFEIKRIFYIYNVTSSRGGHAHHKTHLALISLGGECRIDINAYGKKTFFHLTSPSMCLILEPYEWHTMHSFSPHTTLLVLASELYDAQDYIYEEPQEQ
ncbi:sugar 3,4-ketoisomerase [Helicobacter cholecystus]|uniref:sugar 3,4-ketoisomerase n=1 Tax=Helicobacter cholecystus TaxID=45498 RepID=UPI002738EC04|nr:FdtA/QdtA family cupin domain-containing protein [Helicobacter cholecystus]